jgi:hypothetical protein
MWQISKIRRRLTCYLCTAVVGLISGCSQTKKVEVDNSKWITYKLDTNWAFEAPSDAKITYLKGIDSVPGNIFLPAESIKLEFDSGFEMSSLDTICNLSTEVFYAKRAITRGDYKYLDKPDTLHVSKIDTINGSAATIISPVKTGSGTTQLIISDCNSRNWIGVYGKNILASKQNVILAIYKSFRHIDSK